jgi:hypothetical protein
MKREDRRWLRSAMSESPGHTPLSSALPFVQDFIRSGKRDEVGELENAGLKQFKIRTEREITKIVEEASSRWQVMDVMVIHCYGELQRPTRIVLVVVASAHRGTMRRARAGSKRAPPTI